MIDKRDVPKQNTFVLNGVSLSAYGHKDVVLKNGWSWFRFGETVRLTALMAILCMFQVIVRRIKVDGVHRLLLFSLLNGS